MSREKHITDKLKFSKIRDYKGRGNELITMYINSENSVSNVRGIIDQELRSLEDYDEGTRMKYSVRDTLNGMKEEISRFNDIPENGVIVFAGRVEGDTMCEVFSDELQSEVQETRYITGSQFSTETAEELVAITNPQLIVVLDTEHMIIGYSKNGKVSVIDDFESGVPSKHSKGGQSQSRFERRREEHKKEFFNNCKQRIKKNISEDGSVFIGGPEITLKEFLNKTGIDKSVDVITITTEYVNRVGLRRVSEVADDHRKEEEKRNRDEKIDDFMRMVKENPSLTEYGVDRVRRAVSYGAVNELIVHENEFKDIMQEAESKGASCTRINGQTDKEKRFIQAFNGIGAILNYQID